VQPVSVANQLLCGAVVVGAARVSCCRTSTSQEVEEAVDQSPLVQRGTATVAAWFSRSALLRLPDQLGSDATQGLGRRGSLVLLLLE
jgi:hypothetical protein